MYDLKKMAAEFNKGDKVYVLRAADHNEHGWNNQWTPEMNEMVGKIGIIEWVGQESVSLCGSNYSYPPFVLEKVTCENPFQVGDEVRVRGANFDPYNIIVERVDDLFVFYGEKPRAIRHKYCTLVRTAKKTWSLGCQTFHWEGDLFTSNKVSVSRNQLKAIYEQANSVCAPTSWRIAGFPLILDEVGFGCDGQFLGTVDDLKAILGEGPYDPKEG